MKAQRSAWDRQRISRFGRRRVILVVEERMPAKVGNALQVRSE